MQGSKVAHDFAQRECTVHASLNHANIVKLYGYTETSTDYVLVMEYAGENCDYLSRKVLRDLSPIKSESLLKLWSTQLLSALAYLHDRGIIHQDIKLENVLLRHPDKSATSTEYEPAEIKLIDFGLCSVIADPSTQMSFMEQKVGTEKYQAPEVASGAWISSAIDVWAFGVLLYELAVGYKPQTLENLVNVNYYQPNKGCVKMPFFQKDWAKREPQLLDLVSRCL